MDDITRKQFVVKKIYQNGYLNATSPWFDTLEEAIAYVNRWKNSGRDYVVFSVTPVLDTRTEK